MTSLDAMYSCKKGMFKPYSHNEDYVKEYVWNDLDENMYENMGK
jgi:hypothetical protein